MKKLDFGLLLPVILLSVFGILMIYSASSIIAFRDFNDKYHYFREQLVWMLLGYTALILFSFLDYHLYYRLALPLLCIALIILIAVFIPGIGIKVLGAHRWIDLRLFVLQPSEFVKLSLAIYLSAWFSNREKGRFLAFCLLVSMVMFLIMLQPDMGTASVIFFEALIVYFLSGGNMLHFAAILPVMGLLGFALIIISPYRMNRLTAFYNIHRSLENTSYHVKQILVALGMGGVFGVGLGNSLQKYEYLPENVTDSIFAIIAEELGLLGSSVLIVVFFLLLWRGIAIAVNAKDIFGKLLSGAIVSFLGIQIVINLAAMTALIPLTGIPLPFISYGGSALVVDLSAVGILLNIAKAKGTQKRQHEGRFGIK